MAESSDQESQTEEPTEKKVRDALEQGKIPVSREASIFASMAALMVIQAFLIGQGVQQLTPMLTSFLDDPDGFPLGTGADALNLLTVVGLQALRFLVPLVVILAVFGLAASLLQNAPSLVLQRIMPDLSRISPLNVAVMSVSMNPGAIALAVMFRDANSRATDFVKPMSPALDAA